MSARARRLGRWVLLAVALGVLGLTVPESQVQPTEVALVKVRRATEVDLTPDVVWILCVGSDARPGEDMTRTRGDALQLVGINSATGAAAAIGVPRDSWVSIPGVGSDKINAALYYGGPELLAQAVGNLVGIQPDYVIVTRFPFFQDLVNDIGGITVDNPVAFSDTYLKPGGFKAGKIHLSGYNAMAFARIRHNLPRGDFDRSANQQRVLRGIQAKIAANADRPGWIERGVASTLQHTATGLSPAELFRLAQAAARVDPRRITSCVVQGSIGNVGGASVVLPYTSQAASYGEQARDDATLEQC